MSRVTVLFSKKAWLWLRLGAGLMAALLAFHVLVLVDTRLNWMLTLLATEYGHRLAVLAILLACPGLFCRARVAGAGTVLLLLSSVVLLIPSMQMGNVLRELPAEMEAAFGPVGASVEQHPSLLGFWLGLEKPKHLSVREYAYSTRGKPLKLVFYQAAGREAAPCVLLIHGGGWVNGQPTEFPEWSAHWAGQGYSVASLEYRLAPAHRWPAQLTDVKDALAWLKAHAVELGIDPTRFVLVGRSAGGQIASAATVTLRDPAILGCVAIYAPHDLVFARRFAFEDDVLSSLVLLRQYLGGDPEAVRENYLAASAYLLADRSTCPILMLHGTRDTFVWNMQSRRFAARLKSLKSPHCLVELPWAVHGFDWPYDGPGAVVAHAAVGRFLRTVFRD